MSFRSAAKHVGLGVRSALGGVSAPASSFRVRLAKYAGTVAVVGTSLWILNDQTNGLNLSQLTQHFLMHADSAVQADLSRSPTSAGGVRVDPDTKLEFPTLLNLATPTPPLTLVGLGVRTVTFLRIKVYSAGFYLEDSQTKGLHHIPGWHTFSAQHLLTPPTTTPSDPLAAPQFSGEGLMKALLDEPVACAVRIVPVRNTDFGHLRDGFTRALQARQKLARVAGTLTQQDESRIAESIRTLKALFPSQSVPKGKSLTLLRTSNGSLIVEFESKVLGQVNDPWVARELIMAYFADNDPISNKFKEDVAKCLEGFIQQ